MSDVIMIPSGNAPISQGGAVVGVNLFGTVGMYQVVDDYPTKNTPDIPTVSGRWTDRFDDTTYYTT